MAHALPADAKKLAAEFKKSDDVRDAGLTSPEDVERFDDLVYGPDPMQVLDVYCPKGTRGRLPTIVSIHGGGYVYGDKERYQYYCLSLAQRGFTVVNFSYPLAPGHRFPAHLINTNAAVAFAVSHADEYHVDPENIFFVGDSAGAQINSQYCAAWADADYARLLGFEVPPMKVRATALNCGMYDRDATADDPASLWYLGPVEERTPLMAEQMNVLAHIGSNYPPAFVMSCNRDFLLPNAAPMAAFLDEKGVENELHIYGEDGVNDLYHVFHCDMRSAEGKRCNDEECEFFRRHIVC